MKRIISAISMATFTIVVGAIALSTVACGGGGGGGGGTAPAPKGPCDVGGRALNPGEKCEDLCSSKRGCNICCDNNNNPAGCAAACTSTFGMRMPGGQSPALASILSVTPPAIVSTLSQAGLYTEFTSFVETSSDTQTDYIYNRFASLSPAQWATYQGILNTQIPNYQSRLQTYATAWGLNPSSSADRHQIYWLWFMEYFPN